MFRAALIATVLAASASVASAATDAKGACRADAFRICPVEVAAMDRTAAKACMLKNIPKLSPECRARIEAWQKQNPSAH